jgi:hypothetical protein
MEDWLRLAHWTQGKPYRIERVRLVDEGLLLEGDFAPSPLALLTPEDQVFVAAFVRAHGSIKQMEASFGLSYPTIKKRLDRLAEGLTFVEAQVQTVATKAPTPSAPGLSALLDALETGSMGVAEALARLESKTSADKATENQDERPIGPSIP